MPSLLDPAFCYVASDHTEIRKTFARARARFAAAAGWYDAEMALLRQPPTATATKPARPLRAA